tara:strand:- start:215 stop:943 length:729 start_codon:yes stop_codon:yes gene_type:complete
MSFKKFIFGTDSHGDMICKETEKKFLEFVESYKPHHRIHGGDVFDFRPLRGGSGAEEKSESMKKDLNMGLQFIDDYRPNHILLGNHDDRLWQKANCWTDGVMRDLCENLVLEIEGNRVWKRAKVLPYDSRLGVLKIGDLQFIHGYNAGIYAARQAIQVYKGSGTGVIMGHVHGFSTFEDRSLNRAVGISCGALCSIDMPYNSKNTAKLGHNNGWIFGEIHSGGEWEAWSVRKSGKIWLNPIK